jgi:hypothetical protein
LRAVSKSNNFAKQKIKYYMEKIITPGSTFGQRNLNTYEIVIRFSDPGKEVDNEYIVELKNRFKSFFNESYVEIAHQLGRRIEVNEIKGSAIVHLFYKYADDVNHTSIGETEWTIIRNDSESIISQLENLLTPLFD